MSIFCFTSKGNFNIKYEADEEEIYNGEWLLREANRKGLRTRGTSTNTNGTSTTDTNETYFTMVMTEDGQVLDNQMSLYDIENELGHSALLLLSDNEYPSLKLNSNNSSGTLPNVAHSFLAPEALEKLVGSSASASASAVDDANGAPPHITIDQHPAASDSATTTEELLRLRQKTLMKFSALSASGSTTSTHLSRRGVKRVTENSRALLRRLLEHQLVQMAGNSDQLVQMAENWATRNKLDSIVFRLFGINSWLKKEKRGKFDTRKIER